MSDHPVRDLDAHDLRIIADLLETAGDKFGNHGCNDWLWPDTMPMDARKALVEAMAADDTASPDDPPDDHRGKYGPADWTLMFHFAKRCAALADRLETASGGDDGS